MSDEQENLPARNDSILSTETVRTFLFNWLHHQGVSTVLLFGVIWAIKTSVPVLVAQVRQGYDDNAKALAEITAGHRETMSVITKQEEEIHDDMRAGMRELRMLLINNQILIRELRQEILHDRKPSDVPTPIPETPPHDGLLNLIIPPPAEGAI